MAFDKSKHLIRVQGGREYLPVSARLIWFREEHPDWGITTTPIEINLEKQYAIYQASIFNAEGKLMATATKMENVRGFPDYMEKAETGAVGRALAFCGYGTQFAPELEENNRLADAPYPMNGGSRMAAPRPGNFANNGNRPLPARAPQATVAPEPQRPAVKNEEPDFGEEEEPVENAPRASAVAERPAPQPARPEARREPAPDDDDPFAERDEPAPRAPMAPPARAAAARGAATAATNEAGEPVLSSNRCTEEGCTVTLTPGQVSMSQAKFGRALCPRHQRDATPVAGGANAAPRRAAGTKPEMADTLL